MVTKPTYSYSQLEIMIFYITCSLAVGGRPPTYTRLACRVACKFGASKTGHNQGRVMTKVKEGTSHWTEKHFYLLCHSLNWHDRDSTKRLQLKKGTNKNIVKLIKHHTAKPELRKKETTNTWLVANGNIFGNIPGIAGFAPVIWPAKKGILHLSKNSPFQLLAILVH